MVRSWPAGAGGSASELEHSLLLLELQVTELLLLLLLLLLMLLLLLLLLMLDLGHLLRSDGVRSTARNDSRLMVDSVGRTSSVVVLVLLLLLLELDLLLPLHLLLSLGLVLLLQEQKLPRPRVVRRYDRTSLGRIRSGSRSGRHFSLRGPRKGRFERVPFINSLVRSCPSPVHRVTRNRTPRRIVGHHSKERCRRRRRRRERNIASWSSSPRAR